MLDIQRFSSMNRQRCEDPTGFAHNLYSWQPEQWTNAMAGEVGEACNITKKLLRHRQGVRGNIKPEDQSTDILMQKAAREIADVIIYADLAIQALGFDTEAVLRQVFDSKSNEIGWPGRL